MTPDTPSHRDEVEAWWALIARILAFFLGAMVFGYTMVFSTSEGAEKLAFAAVGVGMMWPVVGAGIVQAFATMRGGGRNE